jgi:hypothetical protein
MGTIAAYAGVLLLVLGAPVAFLVIMVHGFWQRQSRRRDLLEYYRSNTVDEREVREYIRESAALIAERTEHVAAPVFMLIPIGWAIAAILYLIFGR